MVHDAAIQVVCRRFTLRWQLRACASVAAGLVAVAGWMRVEPLLVPPDYLLISPLPDSR